MSSRETSARNQGEGRCSHLVGSTSKLMWSGVVMTALNKGSRSFCRYAAPYTCNKRQQPGRQDSHDSLRPSLVDTLQIPTLKQNVMILLARLFPRNKVCMESASSTSLENMFHSS